MTITNWRTELAYQVTVEDLLVQTQLHFGGNHAKLLQGYENLVRTMNLLFGGGSKGKAQEEPTLKTGQEVVDFFRQQGIFTL